MVKAGRKRKAAAADIDASLERIVDEALQNEQDMAPQQMADEDLFVFDTEPDNAAIHIPHSGRKRPRASKEKKLTRAQAIIAGGKKAAPFGVGSAYAPRKRNTTSKKAPSSGALTLTKQQAAVTPENEELKADIWEVDEANETWLPEPAVVSRPQSLAKPNRPQIAAVEVDPAGCSYNPDYEHHQDAVAEAVAAEMSKQIEKELEPTPIPLTVTQADFALSEMAVGLGSDDDSEAELELSDDSDGGRAMLSQKKKTKKDRTRQERQREQELAAAKKKTLKAMRRDIDSAKDLNRTLSEQEEEVALRQARRKFDKEDKEKTEPPKLGRHKWQPAKLQVLASDDITGSLRSLRAFPMVAKDRFNSLQKRGVVQVTVQQHWTKPTKRRVKQFEKGLVREQAIKGQEEVDALSRSNREREKKWKVKK